MFNTSCVVLALLMLVWLVAGSGILTPLLPTGPIVVDREKAAQYREDVAPGVADLNAVGPLPGLKTGHPASVSDCSVDDGELFQMSVGRRWQAEHRGIGVETVHPSATAETAAGLRALVHALRARDWSVRRRERAPGQQLPVGARPFENVLLRKRTEAGAVLFLALMMDDRGVLASLDTAGRMCSLSR